MTDNLSPRLIPASKLCEILPPRLLPQTHFVAGGLNVIFGPSGTYKSFYILGLAMELALDSDVIYIAAEGASGMNQRFRAWGEFYQKLPERLYFYKEELNLLNENSALSFIGAVKTSNLEPSLIVIDTLARCIPGGDENSAKDIGLAVQACGRIQTALSTGVCLVHHTNKAGLSERGSGALRGAADSMIEMALVGGGVQAKCSKAKDQPEWEPDFFKFTQIGESGLLVPGDRLVLEAEKLSPSQKAVLGALNLEIFYKLGAGAREIVEVSKLAEGSVYRVLSELKRKGLIEQKRKAAPYFISEEAQMLIDYDLYQERLNRQDQENEELTDQLTNSQSSIN